eukprot:jgi/Mesvir1/11774/Mv00141-RA.1
MQAFTASASCKPSFLTNDSFYGTSVASVSRPCPVRKQQAASLIRPTPVKCSYEDAYKAIREQRAKRKADKLKAQEEEYLASLQGGQAQESVPAQTGDVVTVRWSAFDEATGQQVDGSRLRGGPSGAEALVDFQMGLDAGFQPKHGLVLAFNQVLVGCRVGEGGSVYMRPGGSGWFKSYDILDNEGRRLAELTVDERKEPWASRNTRFDVEICKIKPPAGRKAGTGRRAYRNQMGPFV